MKPKIVIGLSGGVDSSVAAHLLQKQGYGVIGLFMINWKERVGSLTSGCAWEDDVTFAEMIAKKLGIPFHVVDFSDYYRDRVINYMFEEYGEGRTPNPDILCNRDIKFDIFMDKALELGAECVATGHYCRKESVTKDGEKIYRLLTGRDPNKDQSYFLCQLSQSQLARSLFPIGHLLKEEVRKIAREQGFITAKRKDSQGICFVGKVDLPIFLQQRLAPKKGNVIEIPAEFIAKRKRPEATRENFGLHCHTFPYKPWNGKVIGEHNGAHFYTIGQRKGLNIGGHSEPLFVLATDVKRNIVYVGEGKGHPGLFRWGLFVPEKDIHWIRPDLKLSPDSKNDFLFRIRYRQLMERGQMYMEKEGAYILFENEQRGIASGQFVVWYTGDEEIGSGTIQ